MLMTNLILLAAFVAMIAGFLWLFRDGDAGGIKPTVVPLDTDDDAAVSVVRVTVKKPDATAPDNQP